MTSVRFAWFVLCLVTADAVFNIVTARWNWLFIDVCIMLVVSYPLYRRYVWPWPRHIQRP